MRVILYVIQIVSLTAVTTFLQRAYGVGRLGVALVGLVAVVWAVCSYIENRKD